MYLESIFIGGDIRSQLPEEAKKFDDIDKTFKKVCNLLLHPPCFFFVIIIVAHDYSDLNLDVWYIQSSKAVHLDDLWIFQYRIIIFRLLDCLLSLTLGLAKQHQNIF